MKKNNYMNDMVYVYAWMSESQSSKMTISKGVWKSSQKKKWYPKESWISKSNIVDTPRVI